MFGVDEELSVQGFPHVLIANCQSKVGHTAGQVTRHPLTVLLSTSEGVADLGAVSQTRIAHSR